MSTIINLDKLRKLSIFVLEVEKCKLNSKLLGYMFEFTWKDN